MKKGDYFIDISGYQSSDATQYAGQSKNTVIKLTESVSYYNGFAVSQSQTSNPVGFYHFARFGGDSNLAVAEANYFLSKVPKQVKYLVLDYESGASGNKQANTNACIAFMDRIAKAGFVPIYYSYVPFTAASIYLDQLVKKYPKSLWLAGYAYGYQVHPQYDSGDESIFKRNLNNNGIGWAFEHTRWYQFTSSAIQGGLDKNIVLIDDNLSFEDLTKGDKEDMDYTIKGRQGHLPYSIITNGAFVPVGHIETIQEFQKSGAKDITIDNDDYNRLMNAINGNDLLNAAHKKLKGGE